MLGRQRRVSLGADPSAPETLPEPSRERRTRRRQLFRRALLTFLLITQAATPAVIASTLGTSSLVVRLAPGLTTDQQFEVIARNGGTVVESIAPLSMFVVEVPSDTQTDSILAFQGDPAVESVDLDRAREAQAVPDDPGYADQWALPKIGWDQVYGTVQPQGTARIAVLDTGVDGSQADLTGRLLTGWSAFGTDPLVDPNGHGTDVATIAAAAAGDGAGIAGVAYANVLVVPIQVLDASGTGQDSDIIAGVVRAVQAGADVILMAFSSPGYSQALQDAIEYAWSMGSVIVAATGNDALTTPTFPAGDAKVIGVSATTQDDTLASFSNAGADTFLAAPGVGISTSSGSMTGTSASAAIVAGAAALLAAVDPAASNATIVGRLARNAEPVAPHAEVGNGRLDLAAAVADTATDPVVPVGAPPVGDGGPFLTTYTAAANTTALSVSSPVASESSTSISFALTTGTSGGGGQNSAMLYWRTIPTGTAGSGTAQSGTDCAVTGTDYLTNSGSGSYTYPTNPANFAVTLCPDATIEADETIVVQFSTSSSYATGTTSGTGTIANDDGVTFSIANVSQQEPTGGAATMTFTVTKSGGCGGSAGTATCNVSYATSDGTATAGSDYTAIATTAFATPFAANDTSKTFTVSITSDTVYEANETFTVTLSNATANAGVGTASIVSPGTATGTIQNDDAAPVFTITGPGTFDEGTTGVAGNTGTKTVQFTVTKTGQSALSSSVNFATADGTATTANSDYVATSGTLNFNASLTTDTQTISVTINADGTIEPNETFTVTLSGATNATITTASATGTIANDDNIQLSVANVSTLEGNSGQTNFTFTVIASSNAPAGGIAVSYYTQDDTGATYPATGANTCGSAYIRQTTAVAITNGIPAGQDRATFNIAVCGDTTAEPNQTFRVYVTTSTSGVNAPASYAVGTILNDDNQLSISASAANVTEGSSGSTTATFTVTSSQTVPTGGVSTTYTVAGSGTNQATGGSSSGDCATGADFWPTSGTVSITSGSTGTITVNICPDAVNETDEGLTVTLGTVTTGILSTTLPTSASTTIVDDDFPSVSLSVNTASIAEAAGTATVTATLSSASAQAVTVAFTTTGTAAASDYSSSPASYATITIPAQQTSATIVITAVQDVIPEDDETVTIALNGASLSKVTAGSPSSVTITILDDDGKLQASVGEPTTTEGDSGSKTVTVPVTLDRAAPTGFSGSLIATITSGTNSPTAGTGTAPTPPAACATGTDYFATTPQTVNISAGSSSGTITFVICGDTLPESDETIAITLSAPTAGLQIVDGTGSLTITNDDTQGYVTITSSSQLEGNSGANTDMSFVLSYRDVNGNPLNAPVGGVSVTVAPTASGTYPATVVAGANNCRVGSGTDDTQTSATSGSIPAGSSTGTAIVKICGDTVVENNETFTVTISAPTNNALLGATTTATGAILNDDTTLTVGPVGGTVTEGSSGSPTFTFTITASPSVPTGGVSVQYTMLGGGTGAGGATTAASGGSSCTGTTDYVNNTRNYAVDPIATTPQTATIATGTTTTVVVPICPDLLEEVDETFTITLASPTTAVLGATTTAVATIVDDDFPTLDSLVASPASVDEASCLSGTCATSTITATLSKVYAQTVTVNLSFAHSSAFLTTPGDYTRTTSITIPVGQTTGTATVTVVDDALDEENEVITVSALSLVKAYAGASNQTTTVTILDDDGAPTVSLVGGGTISPEGGGTATITANLSAPTQRQVTVTLAHSPASGTDFTGATTITIPANSTTANITLTGVNDSIRETDEQITTSISSVTPAEVLPAGGAVTTTIVDDDKTVSGTVLDTDGNPVGGALVTVYRDVAPLGTYDEADATLANTLGTGYSGGDGTFSFIGARNETVWLVLALPAGYEASSATAATAAPGMVATIDPPSTGNLRIKVAFSDVDAATAASDSTGNVFTLLSVASITGSVIEDLNNDGTIAASEPGLANATVTLFRDDGDGVLERSGTDTCTDTCDAPVGAAITTSASGGFSFTPDEYTVDAEGALVPGADLLPDPGTYFLVETDPALHVSSGVVAAANATIEGTSKNVLKVTLADTTSKSKGNRFLDTYANRSVSGVVWHDQNGNGVLDTAEQVGADSATKVAGAVVTLYVDAGLIGTFEPSVDTEVASTSAATGTDGAFTAAGLTARRYWVIVTPPAQWSVTGATGADGLTASGVRLSAVVGTSNLSGGRFLLVAAQGTISGTVYNDNDGNGAFTTGEVGLASPTITVYLDADNSGTKTVGDPETTTNGSGAYTFTGLAPGTYKVNVAEPTSGGSCTWCWRGTRPATVTLASGTDAKVQHVYLQRAESSITGTVLSTASNAGVSGITVTLDSNNDGVADRTTTTDANGVYTFTRLTTNDASTPANSSFGYKIKANLAVAPGTSWNYVNPATSTATLNVVINDGNTQVVNGTQTLVNSTPTTMTTNITIVRKNMTISGNIYNDQNADGLNTTNTQAAVAGSVILYRDQPGTTTGCWDASDTTVSTISLATSANGVWSFGTALALNPGTYFVSVSVTTANWNSTAALPGTPVGTAMAACDGSTTRLKFVMTDSDSSGNVFLYAQNLASIAGTVYHDWNGSGAQNGSEPGVSGVTVNYRRTGGGSYTQSGTVVSGANGAYTIPNIVGGDYNVWFTPAVSASTNVYSSTTSGGRTTDGTSYSVPVATGTTASTGTNFFMRQTNLAISGRAYDDRNANDTWNVGTDAVPATSVELWLDDGDGVLERADAGCLSGCDEKRSTQAIAAGSTPSIATDGQFTFSSLTPGTYFVIEPTDPSGLTSTNAKTGSGGTTGTAKVDNGTVKIVLEPTVGTTYAGATALEFVNGFGYTIAARTYRDLNGDGAVSAATTWTADGSAKDPADSALAGESFSLYSDGGTVGTYGTGDVLVATAKTTNASGDVTWTGLSAGNYLLIYTVTTGWANTTLSSPTCAGTTSPCAAYTLSGNTDPARRDFYTQQRNLQVTGSTFLDANGDGVKAVGSTTQAGSSIGIYADTNGNDVYDAGTDLAATGVGTNPVTTATWTFSSLRSATTYFVVRTVQANFLATGITAGNASTVFPSASYPSRFNVVRYRMSTSTSAGSEFLETQRSATVTGQVYDDQNGNGSLDAGEAGKNGVSLTLTRTGAAGNADAAMVTDPIALAIAAGTYTLPTIAATATVSGKAGWYSVSSSLPPGTYAVTATATNDATWGGSLRSTLNPRSVNLTAGTGTSATNDVFIQQTNLTIAYNVYRDDNIDGTWQSTELTAITPASVKLYRDATSGGTANALDDGDAMVGTTGLTVNRATSTDFFTTAAGTFTGLYPGTYFLVEADATGYVSTAAVAPTGGAVVSDYLRITITNANSTGAKFLDFRATNGVKVCASTSRDGDRISGNATGETPATGLTVYIDRDASGTQNGTEPTLTDLGDGCYRQSTYFDGTWQIRTNTAGWTAVAGEEPVSVTVSEATADPVTGLATASSSLFVRQTNLSIAGTIWNDADADGVQDPDGSTPAEGQMTGATGPTVSLYLDNGDDAYGAGDTLQTGAGKAAQTPTNGTYSFTGLTAGTYFVVATASAAAVPTTVAPGSVAWLASSAAVTTYRADPSGAATDGSTATAKAIRVVLVDGTSSGNVILATPAYAVSGRVTIDLATGTDPGYQGVVVTLDRTDNLATPDATATTNATGAFSFANVTYGTYVLSYAKPAGWTTTNPVGSDTRTLTMSTADGTKTNQNFATRPTDLVVGGNVYDDLNANGTQDTSAWGTDAGLAGVSVTLFLDDGDGVLERSGIDTCTSSCDEPAVTPTPTGTDGSFLFQNLVPGRYFLVQRNLDLYRSTATVAGSTPTGPTGAGAALTGSADVWTLDLRSTGSTGWKFLDARGDGSVTIRVFDDANGDGVLTSTDQNGNGSYDVGEPAESTLSGAAVELIRTGPGIFETSGGYKRAGPTVELTPGSGDYGYLASGLAPGTYSVTTTLPDGSIRTSAATVTVTLSYAATWNARADFFQQVAPNTIVSRVIDDVNANGVFDDAEIGVSGVTVRV
ncbi:MAG: SdrD B-like domain-containing protein [Actinomycetota bacterium]